MEDFFQKLRKIQKKERVNNTLARIDNDFYTIINKYVAELKANVRNDPFSKEHYLLKDSQRIATEICERREHKIADAAIMNIHRSYHLFVNGKPQFDLLDTTPLNLTSEEERLYFAIIDTLKKHRETISLDKLSDDLGKDNNNFSSNNNVNSSKSISSNNDANSSKSISSNNDISSNDNILSNDNVLGDEVLNRLDEVKDAKIILPEPRKNILKQIADSKNTNNNEQTGSKIEYDPNKSTNASISTATDIKSLNDPIKKDEKGIKDENKDIKSISSKSSISKSPTNESKTKTKLNESSKNLSQDKDVLNNIDDQFVDLDSLDDVNVLENSDTQIKSTVENSVDTILVFDDLPSIMGVDEKIYGPFISQDIITIPTINARIFIKNKKARLIRT